MAFVTNYTVEMQTTRKLMTIADASSGWGTVGYELANYFWGNSFGHKVDLSIAIETKDKLYSASFNLTNSQSQIGLPSAKVFGVAGSPITDQKELRYLVAFLPTGDLTIVNDVTYNVDDFDVLPDGIYTINYSVDSGNSDIAAVVYTETFVVTNGAEQVVINAANSVADCLLVCKDINVDNIAEYLFEEAMLYAVNKASLISRKDRILNILDLLNSK